MLYAIFILVLIPVDYYMSSKWIPAYFKFGIPIYNKRLTGKASMLSEIDESHLNTVSESFVVSFVSPVIFKDVAAGQWALRQKSLSSSIMHGKLFVDIEKEKLHLVGYINWCFLPLFGMLIDKAIHSVDFSFITIVLIAISLSYFLQKHMYDKLINYLSG